MASLRGAQGSERILGKLKKLLESGDYYEAHQLYRTIYFRYSNSSRFEDLRTLLFEGANLFLSRNQFNSGADLAGLYLSALSSDPGLKEALGHGEEKLLELSQKIGELYSLIPRKTPERIHFAMTALKLDPNIFNVPLIHRQFALILWKEKNYPESRYHFLHSAAGSGTDCALMLIEYQITGGFSAEVDLFIAQFILQLLCIRTSGSSGNSSGVPSNKPQMGRNREEKEGPLSLNAVDEKTPQQALANETLQCYTAKHPQILMSNSPFIFPLLNFLWFLLLAIDSGKTATFKVLCELYSPTLTKDPAYKDYLGRIGELYFGLQSPSRSRRMGGLFGNLLQSLLEDGDDEPTPSPATAPASSFQPQSQSPRRPHEVEELD